jgi:hypothetical protein
VTIRIGVYMVNYWPPISFVARILTLRWIIPGYDRIFVAPWIALLVGVMLPVALSAAGLEPHIAAPVSASCVLWLVLSLGPTLESWRFTGSFRLAGFFNKQGFSHT